VNNALQVAESANASRLSSTFVDPVLLLETVTGAPLHDTVNRARCSVCGQITHSGKLSNR
jgi:hypothetical protein